MSAGERADLLRSLKRKWDAVNANYQKIQHQVLDTGLWPRYVKPPALSARTAPCLELSSNCQEIKTTENIVEGI